MAVIRKNEDKIINDTEASNQSKMNHPPSVDSARELNLPLVEDSPSVSTPPPAEEIVIDEPSQFSSSHPHALLELSSEVDAFAALQDEDRPDHLDYEEESDVIQDNNELEEENRAYSGINLSHSGDVINLEVSDADAAANRSFLFTNCLDEAKNKCSDTNYITVSRALSILKSNQIPKNTLIIGLGYNRKLSNEITHGGQLNEIEQCLDMNGKQVSDNVARDTIRAYFVEHLNDKALVHNVTNCTDSYRNSLVESSTELNISINSNKFVQTMAVDRSWTFNHIYIDHYRMPHAYLVDMLQKSFFHSIIQMANSSILHPIGQEMPMIFLPFVPHTFHMIHSMENIG